MERYVSSYKAELNQTINHINLKTSKLSTVAFLITILYVCLGCSSMAYKIYGIHPSKKLDKKTVLKYARKYKVPEADCYELDSACLNYLTSFDKEQYKAQLKNHSQPLQALYYNKEGYLQSFHINCFAEGFPNLNWNVGGALKSFPPKQAAHIDSLLPLKKHLSYCKPLTHTKAFVTDDYDYVVIVYWSRKMGRQSKRLIRAVQKNTQLAENQNVKIVYANLDQLMALRE